MQSSYDNDSTINNDDDASFNPFHDSSLNDETTTTTTAEQSVPTAAMSPAATPAADIGPALAQHARAESIELPPKDAIRIVDALKTSEGASSSYIVYVIRFENQESRHRYSDFHSLRQALCSLHPCIIVPPLPPKNSLSSYAIAGANPSKAKEDAALVARRRRMLAIFLNRCLAHRTIAAERVFRRFFERDVPWSEVLHSPPLSTLPKNALRIPASDPTSAPLLALFASLPMPAPSTSLQDPDQRFLNSESFTAKFSSHLSGSVEKVNRRLMKRWNEAAGDWGEMGGGMNGFALRMGEDGNGGLEDATEKVGMAVDGGFTSTNAMLQAWERTFTEPLAEYSQFSSIITSLLKYRHMKHVQYEMTRELLESKRTSLEELERSELEAQRLEKALERVRIGSEGGAMTSGAATGEAEAAEGTARSVAPTAGRPTVLASSTNSIGSSSQRKSGGGYGLFGALSHTFQGMVDVDPEATRRNSIGKTRESIAELDEALRALTNDLRYASTAIQADLDRFQRQKVADIREMCLDFAKFHREWSSKNLAFWKQAREAIDNIETDPSRPPPL